MAGYADVYSAPNLFKNGGFETGDLAFWSTTSYIPSIITGTVDNINGCRTYGKVLISGTDPFKLEHSLVDITAIVDFVEEEGSRPIDRLDFSRVKSSNGGVTLRYAVGDFSIYGGYYTSAVSLKVVGGVVNVYCYYLRKDQFAKKTDGSVVYDDQRFLMSESFSSGTWQRVTKAFEVTAGYGYAVGFLLERVSGSPEVSFGNLQLTEGQYSFLPYTGCYFANCAPKNIILLAMGGSCPVGFEKIYSGEEFFIKEGTVGETGGSTSHVHNYDQYMRDSDDSVTSATGGTAKDFKKHDDWYRRKIMNDPNMLADPTNVKTDMIMSGDDGTKAHKHTIVNPGDADNSIPNYRGYILCKKKS